ncbi:MAG: NADP-dependent phosphogluconate dehydrogenase, partial [Bacteroidetes bacterium]|nr:NADP-dependent phosphogluconate dehydrogenase [Bacteroidota bacterium]
MNKASFGIIGLGVMGRGLAKNITNKGFTLSVYNRTTETEKDVVSNFLVDAKLNNIQGHTEMESFVNSLARPRKILLMVSAGQAVDSVITRLKPMLSESDILIDGGNSHYQDTQRRVSELIKDNIHFLGVGISGGEQGALQGPSMMVGGSEEVYDAVRTIFESISAKDKNGRPCVSLLGPDGCGHFLKTIHNGIEYVEMQLLAECYSLLAPTHSNEQISSLLREWNQDELSGYLLKITADILVRKEGNDYLLDKILDKAGSKGTGSWSSQIAMQFGVPASMINAAVTTRYISMLKEKRIELASMITAKRDIVPIDPETLKNTYTFARIINHYQGFEIVKSASIANNWNVSLSEIARIWTQGCIIKSRLMESFVEILKSEDDFLKHSEVFSEVKNHENDIILTLNNASNLGIATP